MEKRILLLMPYGSVGGMERLALTFYNRMKKLGYKVKVVKLIKLEDDIILFGVMLTRLRLAELFTPSAGTFQFLTDDNGTPPHILCNGDTYRIHMDRLPLPTLCFSFEVIQGGLW